MKGKLVMKVLYWLGGALLVIVCMGLGAFLGILFTYDRSSVADAFVLGGVAGLIFAGLAIWAIRYVAQNIDKKQR